MSTDSDSDSDCRMDTCPVSITITDCDAPDVTYLAPPPLDECAHLENFAFRDATESCVPATPVLKPEELSLGIDAMSPLSSGSTILPEPNRSCHCASTENTADQHKNELNVNWDPFDYAKRYARDDMGEELNNPSARFWRMCLDETTTHDRNRNLLKQLNGRTVDGVLIFAGLFSIVLSTFIVPIWQSLEVQTDYGQVTAILTMEMLQVQRAIAEGRSTRDIPSSVISATPPSVPCSVKWILSLWLVSLTLSLTTALVALLGRQWLHAQNESLSGSARDRARILHSRYMGLVRWRVPEILRCLPIILHASIALFFVGLIIDLARRLSLGVVYYFIAAIVGVMFMLYAVATMILPFFFPQCPYGTPLTYLVYRAFHTAGSALRRDRERHTDALDRHAHLDELDAAAISWIYDSTSNPSVKLITFEAIAGLRVGFKGPIEVKTSIAGELLREVRSACSQGDVYKLELLVRAYVQMQECAARGQVVSDDDWSDGRIVSSLEKLRCPGTPQLEAALCCVGYYPSIYVTRKLYDITASPNRSTLRLHPIIWLQQLTKAHASSHSTLDFLLATEMLNILTSVDFFDTQQFVIASDAPTTSLSEPTIEMALAMVEYIYRASSSRETRTRTSRQSGSSTTALLVYIQQVACILLDNAKGHDIVDFDALEHARNAVRYAIARESKVSYTQSRTYHAAYRDVLLGIASSEYFHKSDLGDVRLLLGSVLSELHSMLVDSPPTTFSAFNLGDSDAGCSNASFKSFGINLFQYILSYNVGSNQASERDVWEIASVLFDNGSLFIFDAFMQMDGIANLYCIFRSALQSGGAPSASRLALAYLSGFLKSSQKSSVNTLESEFLYLHSEENLFPLVVMILYEERHEELLELIAVAPARFTPTAWSPCVLDLLNWTLEEELCSWPSAKRRFARETIEKLYNMFTSGFCLSDDGIVAGYVFLSSNGDSTGCGEARNASRLPGASRARREDVLIPCVGPVSKIWADSYENRLCAVSSAFSSTARPASERVNEWFRAVTAGNTECLDSLLQMMEASTSESDSESDQTVSVWETHTHDALKNTESVS